MPLLQVEDLHIAFGPVEAVRHLSFAMEPGEMLAIVGESGSGKSVTALSLMQLLAGQARVQGKAWFGAGDAPVLDLLQADARALRSLRGGQVAMIFQEPMTSLNPVMTCGAQLTEAIRAHRACSRSAARETALRLLERVRLPDPAAVLRRYPHQLSGGQQQRLMIAMAISGHPALLIADEPTTALDVTVQRAVLELIRELQQERGMAVLFITHDLGLVADVADRVLVMYRGEAVETGTVEQVLRNPRHPYTRALLSCRPARYLRGEPLPVVGDAGLEAGWTTPLATPAPADPLVNPKPVLEVQDLVVEYPAHRSFTGKTREPYRAVDRVSFTVSKGEMLGLVGESGCGKSTLAKALLQLVKPASGSILLNGMPIRYGGHRRSELQIVFQDPFGSLNPRLSIGEAIAEPILVRGTLRNRRQREERVVQLLEQVQLPADHRHRYPHQFSGGQRQRICIARALAAEPSFLVFDESVSALDVRIQAQVLNLLNRLSAELGFSALFISHDLAVVRYLCPRMMVMQAGRIVEAGDSDVLYRHPRHACTQELIRAIPGRSLPEA